MVVRVLLQCCAVDGILEHQACADESAPPAPYQTHPARIPTYILMGCPGHSCSTHVSGPWRCAPAGPMHRSPAWAFPPDATSTRVGGIILTPPIVPPACCQR